MKRAIFFFLLPIAITCQQLLNGTPLQFGLLGNVTYTPSSGGVGIPGYTLAISYSRSSWVGIMFMTATTYSNYDVLIFQRTTTPSSGTYTCTIGDYYVSTGRPTQMLSDTVNSMDLQVTNTTTSDTCTISMSRTKGSTSGQDWQGGDFVKLCFFTSDIAFSSNTWFMQYQSCYGYDVSTGYMSTFQGSYLGTMVVDGVSSSVYGGILGPYLQMQLYWYRYSATMTNTSNIIIQIGDTVSSSVGYDYYVCYDGDYYGANTGSIMNDLSYSGYNDGACSLQYGAASTKISFLRDVNTFDTFDWVITASTKICITGRSTNCGQFSLPTLYPVMSVASAITIGQLWIWFNLVFVFFLAISIL